MDISRGSTHILISFLAASGLSYVFYWVLAWLLPVVEYGVMGAYLAFFMIISFILASGPPQTVLKRISTGSPASSTMMSGIIANFVFGVVIAILFALLVGMNVAEREIVTVLVILILVASIGNVAGPTLLGVFRHQGFAVVRVLDPLLRLLFAVLFVVAGFGALGVFLGLGAMMLVTLSLSLFLLRDIKFWKARGSLDLSFFSQSSSLFVGTVSIMFLMNIDVIAVKFLSLDLADTLTGYYQSAVVLGRLPVWIAWALMMAIFPYISRSAEDSGALIATTLKYTFAFLVPVSLALAVIPGGYMELFFPQEYLEASGALGIVGGGLGFLTLATVLGRSLQAANMDKYPATILGFSVVVQVILLKLLVPGYGIVGAATSTAIAAFMGFILLGFVYIRKFAVRVEASRVAGMALSYIVLSGTLYVMAPTGDLQVALATLVGGALYLLSIFIFRIIEAPDIEKILSGVLPEDSNLMKKFIWFVSVLNRRSRG